MENTKKNSKPAEEISKKKRKGQILVPRSGESAPDIETSEAVMLWKEELEEIKKREFANIDEAVSFIASLVAKKMGFDVKGSEQKFLETFLFSDKEALEEISALVAIREG